MKQLTPGCKMGLAKGKHLWRQACGQSRPAEINPLYTALSIKEFEFVVRKYFLYGKL